MLLSCDAPEESPLGPASAGDVDNDGEGGADSCQVSRSRKVNTHACQMETFNPLTW